MLFQAEQDATAAAWGLLRLFQQLAQRRATATGNGRMHAMFTNTMPSPSARAIDWAAALQKQKNYDFGQAHP